ncbi:hypothetical protein H9P43_004745 [Blastocladiella emersonii ATCC 22665]|nr:hypothetical protein H9P43_004745 [Blastocladiella emersonii ATCC 22665]
MATPTSPSHKRTRTHATIVTHSGSFHADEALACHMLMLLPEYKGAEIVRSRDPAVWATADVLVDVGAVYDPSAHKYDHHQREFVDTFSPAHKTRLSSAGLVYKHFGKRILGELLNLAETDAGVGTVYWKLYEELIEAFDGIDNGVSRFPRGTPEAYKDATTLSSIVAKLNPFWNETDLEVDAQFKVAMATVGSHFERTALYLGKAWLPARETVRAVLVGRFAANGGAWPAGHAAHGHVVVFETYVPWKDHLESLEAEEKVDTACVSAPLAEGAAIPAGLPLYTVFPDASAGWRIQAVPLAPGSFENRKPLPAAWRGLRDAALDAVTGVPGGVFIHASGFIGGHKTREGALKLAEMACAM